MKKSLKKDMTYNEVKRSRCDEIVLDGWMDGWIDRCESPINAKGPYTAQAKKEQRRREKMQRNMWMGKGRKKIRWIAVR